MNKKIYDLNSYSKYKFSNQLVEYLSLSQKLYTINEITSIVKVKIFHGNKTKELTYQEIDLFNLKNNSKNIGLNYMIKLITKNFIIKEENEPNCKFFYYYQIPVDVKKID